MTATTTDRLDGLASATAIKGPCKVASTSNITLSGAQTIDSVSVVADDRVLVTGQTDGRENGIYVASSGAWRRAKDFSSNNDIRTGTQVRVNSGGANSGIWVLTTADPVTIDTSTVTFTRDTALVSGALLAANNLSDVSSAVTALWNLRNNGANIASAATLNLDNATGDQVDVTGAVTITAVTLAEDREVWVRFTGAPQITVGASLIGNGGGANITMAAGDIARFRGYAGGVVRFTVFPVSGQPPGMASLTATGQVLTGGVIPTPDDLGTQTSGTLTLNPGNGPLQRYINNGAHTLAPGSNNGSLLLQVTNGASAGAVTTSGFTKVVGSFTTTNGDDFMCSVVVNNGFSLLTIQALQ